MKIWIAALAMLWSGAAVGEILVLTGGTIHPVSGPPIAGGVMVVEGDTIAAVGAEVEVPAGEGVTVVDLSGKHLYPGFVHPDSVLGLIEVGSVRGTRDVSELGEVNSELRAEVAVNADSLLLPVAVAGGVLTAHVAPRGGVFAGTSAVMRLSGWNWQDMTIRAPVGMHLNYPQTAGGGEDEDEDEQKEQREKALATINDALDDARLYRQAKAAMAGGGPRLDVDPKLEALLPVLAGELPLFVHAREKSQIEDALDWAEEQELAKLVLVTGADAVHLAERLAEKQVPVIFGGVFALPDRRWEPYDVVFTAAARLHAAGVRFAISDGGGSFGASNARNLPFHAAQAAAFGLPKDVALRSVTLTSAEILGVADRLGSLEAGKEASFFVAGGDPLEIMTRIERVWIAGREVDLADEHQRRLYEKYRARPRRSATE